MSSRKHPRLIRVSDKAAEEVAKAAEERGMTSADLASRLILSGVDRLTPVQPLEED